MKAAAGLGDGRAAGEVPERAEISRDFFVIPLVVYWRANRYGYDHHP